MPQFLRWNKNSRSYHPITQFFTKKPVIQVLFFADWFAKTSLAGCGLKPPII
jgi:hypothetical protein